MTRACELSYGATASRGIALIVGLVILAILSMIGVAAFSISTQEERMAGNSRDRMRAFEAAEAALRDCEAFVGNSPPPAFDGTVAGMYPAPASNLPTKAEAIDWTVNGNVHTYAGPLNSEWSRPPACIAETFPVSRGTVPLGTPINQQQVQMAHITAVGYGLNRNTVVRLESYYAM
jgi:type IV pilus assembly protein PilX